MANDKIEDVIRKVVLGESFMAEEQDAVPGPGDDEDTIEDGDDEFFEEEVVDDEEVIDEEVLDDVPFMSKAQYKLIKSERCVVLHEVPQDGEASNRDHWLWDVVGNVADSSSITAAKNYRFHWTSFFEL